MTRFTMALVLGATFLATAAMPASAGRYNVVCIAPSGPWCRIACTSNRTVACYANVVNGRCLKTCRYQ